jgi:hypothetical protein
MNELKDKAMKEVLMYCHMLNLESNLENSIDALINAGLITDIESQNKIKSDAFKAGFSVSGDGFNDDYGASEERVSELAIEYVEGRHE